MKDFDHMFVGYFNSMNHLSVISLIAFVLLPKKASRGLRGVTMSSLSTNCFSWGLLFIIWFHLHSHISWTRYPKAISWSILFLISSQTSYMVLFGWMGCLMDRFGKHLRHLWKKHPWNSYTVRVCSSYPSTRNLRLPCIRVLSPLFPTWAIRGKREDFASFFSSQ